MHLLNRLASLVFKNKSGSDTQPGNAKFTQTAVPTQIISCRSHSPSASASVSLSSSSSASSSASLCASPSASSASPSASTCASTCTSPSPSNASSSGLGLALEGGGAKGAYHMGVVRAFLEEGYKFGGVTGTSIGALNGAAIAQGDFEKAYRLWETVEPSMLFDISSLQYMKLINKDIDREAIRNFASQAKKIIDNKGIDTSKIRRLVNALIDEGKLRKSRMDFGLVTVSVSDMKPLEIYKEDIPDGMLLDYLLASANLPIFGLRKISGKYFIDGGFYDNCPINLIAGKGYKDIIAVRTLAFGIVQEVKYPGINLISITPSDMPGKVLDFRSSELNRGLKIGYYDAIRFIKGLKGRKYCIHDISEKEIMEIFMKWNNAAIEGLAAILEQDVSHIDSHEQKLNMQQPVAQKLKSLQTVPQYKISRRYLFEGLLPQIAAMLGFKDTAPGYNDVVITLFEYLAEEKGLDKYRIYTFRQLMQEIRKLPPKSVLHKSEDSSISKLLSHPSKKALLINAAQYIADMMR